jgi:hypothetical protein
MIKSSWRYHIEWSAAAVGFALWVPWRHPSRPLIYAFWYRRPSWRRMF